MTIRNVPDDTRDRLAARAERAGQSLQEYLRALLIEQTARPTTDEWIEQVRSRAAAGGSHVTVDDIVADVRAGRGELPFR